MSELWTPNGFSFLRHRATRKTVTLPSGERALVTVDDSGTVTQILRSHRMEADEKLDAIVRPKTVTIHVRKARADVEAR